MRVEDLMVGDLIFVDGRPTRVYGIMERHGRIYDTMTNDISLKRCEPIPIAPEVLEKTGFARRGSFYHISNDYYDVTVSEMSDSIWIIEYHDCEMNVPNQRLTVCYLHELHQAFVHFGIDKEIEIKL